MKVQCSDSERAITDGALFVNNLNNSSNANGNNNLNNNGSFVRITQEMQGFFYAHDIFASAMSTNDLYSQLCSYENLKTAFKKARKGKTQKKDIIEFQKNLKYNLIQLQTSLLLQTYRPKPLETFIISDPKTRKISKSDFRDRIVHHAICNIIEPIFEKQFIYDSYANRVGKGTLKAIERFTVFARKVSKNYRRAAFVLKADIRHYFETVDQEILFEILKKKIADARVLWLIRLILQNYHTKEKGKGMPLGNLTSQFFANVYLNELDKFVKHILRVKHYIRYVDDFVIFSTSNAELERHKNNINIFLRRRLLLELHPDKSKIIPLYCGVEFLGIKIFPHHKIIKKRNLRKFKRKLNIFISEYDEGLVDFDTIYNSVEGWYAYVKNANTYKLTKNIRGILEDRFKGEISSKELDRYLKLLPK